MSRAYLASSCGFRRSVALMELPPRAARRLFSLNKIRSNFRAICAIDVWIFGLFRDVFFGRILIFGKLRT